MPKNKIKDKDSHARFACTHWHRMTGQIIVNLFSLNKKKLCCFFFLTLSKLQKERQPCKVWRDNLFWSICYSSFLKLCVLLLSHKKTAVFFDSLNRLICKYKNYRSSILCIVMMENLVKMRLKHTLTCGLCAPLIACFPASSLLPFSPPSPSLFPFPIPFFLSSLPSFWNIY